MKRVIAGILVLITAWRFLQIPSINGAFFAFLTLGVNPFTNHSLSTPLLIAVVFFIGFAVLLLFFSQAVSDVVGGLYDWLTHAEREYRAVDEGTAVPAISLASLPACMVMADVAEPKTATSLATFTELATAVRAFQLPQLPTIEWPHFTRLSQAYRQFVARLQARLQSLKTAAATPVDKQAAIPDERLEQYNTDLAPELAEVLAIFEQLALVAEQAEPPEAVIVTEKKTEPTANAFSALVRKQLIRVMVFLGSTRHALARNAVTTSAHAVGIAKATETQVWGTVRSVGQTIMHMTRTTHRLLYCGLLLVVLGSLLGAAKVVEFFQVAVLCTRRVGIACAGAITLSMFAVGHAASAMVRAIGHGLASLCRGIYWLLSNIVMFALLGAGYLIFIFALLFFMVWEICEPHARKLDRWLGDNLDGNNELAEATKVGREMSRTFTQWYHELRKIKHSIYH